MTPTPAASLTLLHFPEEELAAGLQQAEISILSHEACVNYWGQNIEETKICRTATGAAFCTLSKRQGGNTSLYTTKTQSHALPSFLGLDGFDTADR